MQQSNRLVASQQKLSCNSPIALLQLNFWLTTNGIFFTMETKELPAYRVYLSTLPIRISRGYALESSYRMVFNRVSISKDLGRGPC